MCLASFTRLCSIFLLNGMMSLPAISKTLQNNFALGDPLLFRMVFLLEGGNFITTPLYSNFVDKQPHQQV